MVDTIAWSLALRRDEQTNSLELKILVKALDSGEKIYCSGIILLELLQGFSAARAVGAVIDRFSAIPMLIPDTADHIGAADIHNKNRRKCVQIVTIDALIEQLSLR